MLLSLLWTVAVVLAVPVVVATESDILSMGERHYFMDRLDWVGFNHYIRGGFITVFDLDWS